MKGISCLKYLTSTGKLYICSKRAFYGMAYIQNLKKLQIDNKFGVFQIVTPIRLLSMQQFENKELQNVLSSIGFTDEEIENSLKDELEILRYPAQKLHNVATALIQQGMIMTDIKQIFLNVPHIAEVNINSLNITINKWRELRLSEEKMFKIFTKFPLFLLLTPEYIDSRLKEIVCLFTNSDIIVLLETMPSIFINDWNTVIRKVHYIQSFMGFTQIQMMRSSALEHSLMHIKTRHMFISLSGVFKARNPKKIILNNPSLKAIVDSTDQDFVNRCGLSLEEYYIFCDIMAAQEMDDDID